MPMQMVILCGGLATRLGNLTKDIPKSMIEIEGKPFLEYQIENLINHSFEDILLCVGHLSEKIVSYFGDGKDFGIDIKYSHDGDKPLGPIGALKNADPLLEDLFFIMYGDSYLLVDFQKVYTNFMQDNKLGMMVVYKNYNEFDKSNITIKDDIVAGYGEKDAEYIDYGTSILRKNALDIVPKKTIYSTKQFFSDLIRKKELLAFEATKRFYHIGTPEALEEFRNYIRR